MTSELRLQHRYPLRRGTLGAEAEGGPPEGSRLVTMQFKFKPASVDSSRRGELTLDSEGSARASFLPREGESPQPEETTAQAHSHSFRGVAGEGGEFLLVMEESGGELGFRLERVATSVLSLLHERGADFEGKEVSRPPRKSRKVVLPTQMRQRPLGRAKKQSKSASAGEAPPSSTALGSSTD